MVMDMVRDMEKGIIEEVDRSMRRETSEREGGVQRTGMVFRMPGSWRQRWRKILCCPHYKVTA